MKNKFVFLTTILLCLAASAFGQKMSKADSTEKALMDMEQMAWKNMVDKKYDDFARIIAEDYQGIYDIEVTTKAQELAELKQITIKKADVTNIKVKMLDPMTAIVTSNVMLDMIMPDGKSMMDNVRATTVVVKRGDKWLVVYHSHISIKPAA